MMSTPARFSKPPLHEQYFCLSFRGLEGWRLGHFGAFWSELGISDYPDTSEHPLYSPPGEELPARAAEAALRRVWFVHRDRAELIQLQWNRIWLHWRDLSDGGVYPGYEKLQSRFGEVVDQFQRFCAVQKLGPLERLAGEICYVNRIYAGQAFGSIEQASDVVTLLKPWRTQKLAKVLGSPAGFGFSTGATSGGALIRVDVRSGNEASGDRQQLINLELRGTATDTVDTFDQVREWYREVHQKLLDSFLAVTNPSVQKDVWGHVRGS